MKVVVFGATGGIGRHVVDDALAKGYEVVAFVRDASKVEPREGLIAVEGSIDSVDDMRRAIRGADAVIWCVGIPLKRKYGKMASLEGHKNLIVAMDAEGVKRLIDWGTPSVPFAQDKKSFITVVPGIMASIALTQAKKEMVGVAELLEKSDLDWTMVRFMAPNDKPAIQDVKVGFGDTKMSMAIPRASIAQFMVDQLTSDRYVKSMPIIGS